MEDGRKVVSAGVKGMPSVAKRRVGVPPDTNMAGFLALLSSKFEITIVEVQSESGDVIDDVADIVNGETIIAVPEEAAVAAQPTTAPPAASGIAAQAEVIMLQVMTTATALDFPIRRLIGGGQNGLVFEATCTRPGFPDPSKVFALKLVFNYGVDTRSGLANAFEHEYAVLSILPLHPNVLRFWGTFWDRIPDSLMDYLPEFARLAATYIQNGVHMRRKAQFVVFDYHPMSLHNLECPRLPVPTILKYASDLLSGVAHLESQSVAHLDLKPDNVLVSTNDSLVLCDFGCAVRFRSTDMTVEYHEGMSPGGNLAHLSPELLNAVSVARSRAGGYVLPYSKQPAFEVGTLIYEVAVGGLPWPDYPHGCRLQTGVVAPILETVAPVPARYPPEFAEMVYGLIHPDHRARWPVQRALTTVRQLMRAAPPAVAPAPTDALAIVLKFETREILLNVPLDATVGALTAHAIVRLGLTAADASTFFLLFNGKRLNPAVPVGSLGLTNHTRLNMVSLVPGAVPTPEHFDAAAHGMPHGHPGVPVHPAAAPHMYQQPGAQPLPQYAGAGMPATASMPYGFPGAVGGIPVQPVAMVSPQNRPPAMYVNNNSSNGNAVAPGVSRVGPEEVLSVGRPGFPSATPELVWPQSAFGVPGQPAGAGAAAAVPGSNVRAEGEWPDPSARPQSVGMHAALPPIQARPSIAVSAPPSPTLGSTAAIPPGSFVVDPFVAVGTTPNSATAGTPVMTAAAPAPFAPFGPATGVPVATVMPVGSVATTVADGSLSPEDERKADLALRFDAANCSALIELANDNLSASCSSAKWGTVLVSGRAMYSGRHSFQFQIDSLNRADKGGMAIGVVDAAFKAETDILGQKSASQSWAYSGRTGDKGTGSTGYVKYGAAYADGDVIGVELDLDARVLCYTRNGVNQGIAFDLSAEPLNLPLRVAVTMGAIGRPGGRHKITFLHYNGDQQLRWRKPTVELELCNDNTAVRARSRRWATAIAAVPAAISGYHEWQVKIDSMVSSAGGVAVGVVADEFDPAGALGVNAHSWGYSGRTGDKGSTEYEHAHAPFIPYGCKFDTGATVTIHLDLIRNSLAFSTNGSYQGVAFTGCFTGRRLRPAVCLGGVVDGTPHQVSLLSLPLSRLTQPRFSMVACFKELQLSNNYCTVATSAQAWGTVVLDVPPVCCGKHKWTFKIDILEASSTGGVAIGVVGSEFDPALQSIGVHPNSWGYSGRTGDFGDGKHGPFRAFGQPFATGDVVQVVLDMDEGTLSFAKNGLTQGSGPAATDLKGLSLRPAVCLGGIRTSGNAHQVSIELQ